MSPALRPSGRQPGELRPVRIQRGFTKHAEGSVLVEFGDTRVLCTASVEERVPAFLAIFQAFHERHGQHM